MNIIEKMALTIMEERIEAAWCFQDKAERKHRLKTVIALSVELDKIRSVDRFCSALGESAIECIIQGEWNEVETWIEHFTFSGEHASTKERYFPLWENFRVILQTALAEERAMVPGVAVRSN